ncbi:MAG: methyltransferase domain-containing protein [SAR324 cluster bacterium]|nr:methyltransferase domain-containing protein [SAR324 cluster bacterium]
MIVSEEVLSTLNKKVVMVDGCFDPLHVGHLKYFEEASKFGLPVFCNVTGDNYIKQRKQRNSLLPDYQRVEIINALRPVEYVHLCKTSTQDILKRLKPAKYIKGMDWKDRGLPWNELEICREHGIEIVYLDSMLDSSTKIAEQFLRNNCHAYVSGKIDDFSQMINSQLDVKTDYYDNHYFQGEWRTEGNSYSIETRRAIEAKNPFNIKDVFNPQRILDVGCGPGALMLFLHELGIESHGIDFSQAAQRMAPPEIRERIHVAPVTEYHDFGVKFDLVICREMIEHLTVLQIVKVVRILAQYTSKYLYITTRFHPEPQTLLDITDEKHVDPSHITLLNKDFLKLLFLLEGLSYRKDLEQKMDWKNYGRVLVFEKI